MMKQQDGLTDLDIESLHSRCYRVFYKSWSAYTKYLKSHVIEKSFN